MPFDPAIWEALRRLYLSRASLRYTATRLSQFQTTLACSV